MSSSGEWRKERGRGAAQGFVGEQRAIDGKECGATILDACHTWHGPMGAATVAEPPKESGPHAPIVVLTDLG